MFVAARHGKLSAAQAVYDFTDSLGGGSLNRFPFRSGLDKVGGELSELQAALGPAIAHIPVGNQPRRRRLVAASCDRLLS